MKAREGEDTERNNEKEIERKKERLKHKDSRANPNCN